MSGSEVSQSTFRRLVWSALDRRFARRYKAQIRAGDAAASQVALVTDNCWLLTHEKSGTTYLCNALAFRNAIELGIEDRVDFDTIHLGGVFRSTSAVLPTLERVAAFARVNRGLPLTIHTHLPVDARFHRAVMLTRNVFDYCVSAHNFLYKNRDREGRRGVSLDDAIPDLVGRYCGLLKAQLEIANARPADTIFLRYEDLMQDPQGTLTRLLEHFGLFSEPEVIARALAAASVDAVKAHETRRGKPIVAGTDFSGKSFIRSGATGEFRTALSAAQQDQIRRYVADAGIPERIEVHFVYPAETD